MAVIGLVVTVVTHNVDVLSKTTVIYYKLDQDAMTTFKKAYDGLEAFFASSRIWDVQEESRLTQWEQQKRQAGAGSLIARTRIIPGIRQPPYVKTNIATPSLPLGKKKTLYFFPDCMLVYTNRDITAIEYGMLSVTSGTSQFIESGSVPGDARIVDKTWRYVNKDGSPDRRFKNNTQIPITLYGDVSILGDTLSDKTQTSREHAPMAFKGAIEQLAGFYSD